MNETYVPLHSHSDFSIGDSILTIPEYVSWAKMNGISAIALTDHGNMCGSFNLNDECLRAGIKSIIGIEAYCTYKEDFEKLKDKESGIRREHVVLLAKNQKGYHDLLKLLGKSMRDSFYYRPIMFYEDVFASAGDIIFLSGCTAGKVAASISLDKPDVAEKFINEVKKVFKDDFYLEVMENMLPEQRKANDWIKDNYKRLGVRPVLTVDTHYAKKDYVKIHDVHYLNYRKQSLLDKDVRMYTARNLWLKQYKEIIDECTTCGYDIGFIKEALNNTLDVASKVEQFNLNSDKIIMPKFCDDSFKVLKDKALEGMKKKNLAKKEYVERLKTELRVIKYKNMADYFLIIADIVDFANKNDILVGVGRGSAAGSLLSYVLGITKIDPLKYRLYFERFLTMVRKDPPDIDMDFDSKKRPMIEEYLKQKYGNDSVSHVISFGRYGIKGALRDAFRVVHGGEHKFVIDSITKHIGDDEDDFKKAIEGSLKLNSANRKFYEKHAAVFKIAMVLFGKIRHYSLHAAGTVIVPGKLEEHIPVIRINDQIVAGFQEGADIRTITQSGLMKFDLLGLNACCIIKDCLKLLNGKANLEDIILDDNNIKVLNEFAIGNTFGCFQFEGSQITKFVKKVNPTKFDDLIAINALYRPAVIQAKGLENYLTNKRSFDPNSTDALESLLKDTYGVMVYQEQTLDVFHKLGGLSLEEADEARHTLKLLFKGKTDYSDFEKLMAKFKEGCHQNTNYDDKKIVEIMEMTKQFASYSFNKSHSAGYAMIGYIMMYLKTLYPHEYFAALLSNTNNADSVQDRQKVNLLRNYVVMIQKTSDIRIVHPDINKSGVDDFKIEGNTLIFPLGKIKGVGEKAANEIVSKAPYTSFKDFTDKVTLRVVNKRVIKALIYTKALTFDDALTGFKDKYNEEIDLSNAIATKFEYLSIIFEDEFDKLIGASRLKLKAIKGKRVQNASIVGMLYKFRKLMTKGGRLRMYVGLYDGSEYLEDCLTKGQGELEEGQIISCVLSAQDSYNQNYGKYTYHVEKEKKWIKPKGGDNG